MTVERLDVLRRARRSYSPLIEEFRGCDPSRGHDQYRNRDHPPLYSSCMRLKRDNRSDLEKPESGYCEELVFPVHQNSRVYDYGFDSLAERKEEKKPLLRRRVSREKKPMLLAGCFKVDLSGDEGIEGSGENSEGSKMKESRGLKSNYNVHSRKASSAIHDMNMFKGCRNVSMYENIGKINEGRYGVVYKARDKRTGKIVALKKIMSVKSKGNELPSVNREIELPSTLSHPNIVNLKKVVTDECSGEIFLVMEHMEVDIREFTRKMEWPFFTVEVKFLMRNLLKGVCYLHENNMVHRDLKPENLLLDGEANLKICDFGLSRRFSDDPQKAWTHGLVTLWYRAPELLMGTDHYSSAIDMWSVGCIMAELTYGKPIFQGSTEIQMLEQILRVLGVQGKESLPGLSKLLGVRAALREEGNGSLLRRLLQKSGIKKRHVFCELSDSGLDLLNKLLAYDPKKRISAREALNHGWFREWESKFHDLL